MLAIALPISIILSVTCFLLLKGYYDPIEENDVFVPKLTKKSFLKYRIEFLCFLVPTLLCLFVSWRMVANENIHLYVTGLLLCSGAYCILFFMRTIKNIAAVVTLRKTVKKFKNELKVMGIASPPGLFKLDDEGKITSISDNILSSIIKEKNIKAAKYFYKIVGTVSKKLNLYLVNHILKQNKNSQQFIDKNTQYFEDNYHIFFKPCLVEPDDYHVMRYLYSGKDNKNLTIIHEKNNLYKILTELNSYRDLLNKEYFKVLKRLLERDDRYEPEEKAFGIKFKISFSTIISLFKKGSLPDNIQVLIKEAKANNDIDFLKELYLLSPYDMETCLLIVQSENPNQLSFYKLDHYENTIRKFITDIKDKKSDFIAYIFDHCHHNVIHDYGISSDVFIDFLKELCKTKYNNVYLSIITRLLTGMKQPIFKKLLSHTKNTIESLCLLLKIFDNVKSKSIKRKIETALQEITEEPFRVRYTDKNSEGIQINTMVSIAKIYHDKEKK
jgi:hypothetical protein